MALSPHLDPDAGDSDVDLDHRIISSELASTRMWRPKRVLLTQTARDWPLGLAIAERCAAFGILSNVPYAFAKSTLAVTVASPSKLKLQSIAPSADWRLDLAEGCPAHCSYCYLAGSLKGAPITRACANLDEIFAAASVHLGQGRITSRSAKRAHEGTTYEASCYSDPLGIEHLTGSLSAAVAHFAGWLTRVIL